jgi:predicted nucleic acid-binding Zn ribbon protein
MFRRHVESIADILPKYLRQEGLETPLLQVRALKAWDQVGGNYVARQTQNKFIKNQVLYVKLASPALRQELSMRRSVLVKRINDMLGSNLLSDIHFY